MPESDAGEHKIPHRLPCCPLKGQEILQACHFVDGMGHILPLRRIVVQISLPVVIVPFLRAVQLLEDILDEPDFPVHFGRPVVLPSPLIFQLPVLRPARDPIMHVAP